MKRIAVFLVLSSLLLSSCTWLKRQEEVPVVPPAQIVLEKKIGLVSTAEDQQIQNPLTVHVLLTESGEKIFIESVSVNLKRYVLRRVEAEGRFNDAKTVFLIETMTSLGNETQVKSLYQNASFGLKFQYPSLWSLKTLVHIVGLKKIIITPYEVDEEDLSTVDTITVELSENNRRLPPREWLSLDEQYRSVDPADTAVYQQSSIGAALLNAVKKTVSNGERIEFFVSRDTFLYRFSHATVGDADKDLYRNAFFDLVASFEFIPFGKEEGSAAPIAPETSVPPTAKPLLKLAEPELSKRRETEEQIRLDAETKKKVSDLQASRKLFIDYIEANIFQLIPDPQQLATGMTVLQVEFVAPENEPGNFNAIYAVYDYSGLKKVLLSVPDRTKPEAMTRLAAFTKGETQDWKLIEGTDTAKSSDKTVITLRNGESAAVVVKKGMTLLDAKSLKVKIQYPSSWYWAYRDHGYSFSDKPVSGENVLIHLTKNPETLPNSMTSIGELSGKPATQGEMAEALSICVQATAKYCLSGDPSYVDTMKSMLETLQE